MPILKLPLGLNQ